MLFDSVGFLLFLPTVIGLYFLLPHKFRWIFLLLASYFFYACWKVEFLLLIIYSTLVAYGVALKIANTTSQLKKRIWLTIGLLSNFGVLFLFKYFNFFIGKRYFFLDFVAQHPKVEWLTQFLEYGIPVGISFFTFQAVGYTLDVYFNRIQPEKNPARFALFVGYFPQLVAGPIERFSNLHHQLFQKQFFTYTNLSNGFRLLLFGLFIKMVIADNLAPLVDPVFSNPLIYSQADNGVALLFFSIQIYADFHGYSLIAIGVAMMMGIRLMDNFKTPYLSVSIKEFWTRWHISLSSWFRDYLYHPLGGNRVKTFRWIINILIIFIVSGIWHGANFTFLIWGLIHGTVYLIEQLTGKIKFLNGKFILFKLFGFIKTFSVVTFAWLFFRSDNLANAYLSVFKILGISPSENTYKKIQSLEHSSVNVEIESVWINGVDKLNELVIKPQIWVVLLILIMSEMWIRKSRFDLQINNRPFAIRWFVYALLIYGIMALSGPDFYQFIYFQF